MDFWLDDASDEVVIEMKIGEFPRFGVPVKDKNGADVFSLPEGMTILSYDHVANSCAWSPITTFTVEDNCQCVRVIAESKEVIVSSNESLAVFDHSTGELVKKAPKDSLGCFVPSLRKMMIPFGTYGNRDLGWWIGSFLSDGWVSQGLVGYAKVEEKKRKEFERIARQEFTPNFLVKEYVGKRGADKLGDSMKIHCYGKDLHAAVTALNMSTASSGVRQCMTKTIPKDMILKGSEEFLWGILSGLVDGDGSLTKNMCTGNPRFYMNFSTSSESLLESIKLLLFRIGLRYGVTVTPPRGFSKTAYNLVLSTTDICQQLDKLSLIGEREMGLIAEWKTAPLSIEQRTKIPITQTEITRLKELAWEAEDKRVKEDWYKVNKTNCVTYLLYQRLCKSACYLEIADKLTERLNIDWLLVTDVEDAGLRQVFDFGVTGTKVFAVNNGLIVWDTMSFTVPVSDAAVRESILKMTPTRNLLSVRTDQPNYVPSQEFTQGLHFATKEPAAGKPVQFPTKQDALNAYHQGKIRIDTPIVILSN